MSEMNHSKDHFHQMRAHTYHTKTNTTLTSTSNFP